MLTRHAPKMAATVLEVLWRLRHNTVKPFISDELRAVVNRPIVYDAAPGVALAHGALPLVCEVWVSRRLHFLQLQSELCGILGDEAIRRRGVPALR